MYDLAFLEINEKTSEKKVIVTVEFFFLSFLLFLGPLPGHMEVPRLGAELELEPLAYARATSNAGSEPSLQHTTAHGNAGSLTH